MVLSAVQNSSQFEIERFIGEGGIGRVYLAHENGRPVALKFLEHAFDPQLKAFFREEVRLLSLLSHPNLVKIYDYFEQSQGWVLPPTAGQEPAKLPSGPAFSMEYVDGKPLDQISAADTAEEWIDILAQICQGLQYLHARNILHRDLKPSNILRGRDGQIKILDFSISSSTQIPAGDAGRVGTLSYMPPEAFVGAFDFRSDLFSLGVLLYQLMAKRFPYDRPLSPKGRLAAKPPPPLHSLRPDLPAYLCDLIDRFLEISPQKRPTSALTVLRILQEHSDRDSNRFQLEETEAVFLKTPLVGRQKESKALTDALRSASNTPLVFLQGPTGIGRSRLLEELRWQHLLDGGTFLSLRPEHAQAWTEKISETLGIDTAGSDLLASFESIAQHRPEKTTLLAFSDMHRWPESAIRQIPLFIQALERAASPLRLVLENNSELKTLDADAFGPAEMPHSLRLDLKDLSAVDSRELVKQACFGRPLPETAVEAILRAGGGRPMLILESLRYVLSGGRIEEREGIPSLPKSLEEASKQKVLRLSRPAQNVLAMILSHPDATPVEVFLETLSQGDTESKNALLELDANSITARRTPEDSTLRLSHPSLKDALLKALPPELLQSAHRRWLAYLQDRRAEQTEDDSVLIALAHHALQLGETSAMREIGIDVLQAFARRGDFQKAVDWSDRLLALEDSGMDLMPVYGYRAPYLYRLGKYAEAVEAYEGWFQRRVDDETKEQRVKFFFFTGLTQFSAHQTEDAQRRLEECLRTGDSRIHAGLRPFHARAHNLMAALLEKEGAFKGAQSHLRQALDLGENDPLLLSETESRLGALEASLMNFEAAETHYLQASQWVENRSNPQTQALPWSALALLEKDRGRLAAALDFSEKALALSKSGGELPQWARYLGNRGAVLLDQGMMAAALEDFRKSESVLKAVGTPAEHLISQIQLASAYQLLGNHERYLSLESALLKNRRSLETFDLWGAFQSLQGEAAYRGGRFEESAVFFRQSTQAMPKSAGAARLLNFLSAVRAELRAGYLPDPRWLDFFPDSAAEPGNQFHAWWRVIQFFSKSPADVGKEDFQLGYEAIGSVESPLLRLDLFELISLHLHRLGFKKLSERVAERCRQEWSQLFQRLPEEYKMDFEKNQSLRDFEDELGKEPVPPKARPAASEEDGARAARGQISEARFRQFCEINRQIAQKSDLEDILDRVMSAAIELTGAERGFLLLKNPGAKKSPVPGFEVKAARNLNQQALSGPDLKFSFSVVRESMDRGTPLLTDNAQEDARFRESKSVHQFQLQSILVAPLELEGEIFGALYLDHRFQPESFLSEDVVIISGFASQASLAIQKAKMVEELKAANDKLSSEVQTQAQHIVVLSEELEQSKRGLKFEYSEIVGKSPPMMKVFQTLDHVTQTKIPVWIWGESGTGKELVARSLHFNSTRKEGNFVAENCSAIPENLLESELFGYKKGAFTHADKDRVGLFEQASGGTLFLDEVADMSLGMQVKLLRVLQEGEIRPLGANKKVKVDVRLVTASNRDLQQMVREGSFRQDLFFRINGMTLRLPPLRERKDDIPLLVHFLSKKIAKEFELKPSEVSQDAFQVLMDYAWPGNIRELEGVVRNLLLFAQGQVITKAIFTQNPGLLAPQQAPTPGQPNASLFPPEELSGEKLEQKKQLVDALIRHRMDKQKVAGELGISLKSVYSRMERFEMPIKKKELKEYLEREARA